MKKLLSVLVAALLLGTLTISANAAELQNYSKDATILDSTTDGANVAIDGDTATVWTSSTADEESITIDLGSVKAIGYFQLTFGDAVPSDYKIEWTSNADASGLSEIVNITGNTEKTVEHEVTLTTNRVVKITFTASNGDAYSLADIIIRKSKDAVDTAVNANYPSSGVTAPDGSKIIMPVELIGNEEGWGGNASAGRAAAFDGDINSFFDPLGVGDGFAGIDAGKEYVVTKIAIHPRDGQLGRFYGASIQGTNDDPTSDDAEWTDIWMSVDAATEWTWYEMEESDFDETGVGYRYFRYYNMLDHGDVAEVELYGYPVDGVWDDAAAAPAEEPAPAETEPEVVETEPEVVETEPEVAEPADETVETPAAPAETTAPQTFDMGIIAAVTAAVSALGYAISKKRR